MLSRDECELWANKIIDYYDNFDDISDYFLERKEEKLLDIMETFDGFGQCDNLFDGHSVQPKDFEIELIEVKSKTENILWDDLTQITATFPIESVPGRNVKILVREKNSRAIVGMLRLSSPIITIKPRNMIFNEILNADIVNNSIINGSVIVPAQPFGYNMLGGKLMALVCNSNEVRDIFNKKYDTNISLFETTSLYGNIKGVSQYDGLKPFLKFMGETESKLPLSLADELHKQLVRLFREKDSEFGKQFNSGVKNKVYNLMIRELKKSLKKYESPMYDIFVQKMGEIHELTTKKRFYYSDYGMENVLDVMKNGSEPIYRDGMSRDRFDLNNLVDWWKKKAQKRYDKLKEENLIRTELEYWTEQRIKDRYIDIIR